MSGLASRNRALPLKQRAATDPFPRMRGGAVASKERVSTEPFPPYPRSRRRVQHSAPVEAPGDRALDARELGEKEPVERESGVLGPPTDFWGDASRQSVESEPVERESGVLGPPADFWDGALGDHHEADSISLAPPADVARHDEHEQSAKIDASSASSSEEETVPPTRYGPIALPPSLFKWMMRQSLPALAEEDRYEWTPPSPEPPPVVDNVVSPRAPADEATRQWIVFGVGVGFLLLALISAWYVLR